MNNLGQMSLIMVAVIVFYEVFMTLVAYLLRDKIKRALNVFLGQTGFTPGPTYEDLASENQASTEARSKLKAEFEENHSLTANTLHEMIGGIRSIQRSMDIIQETASFNSVAIDKLKKTKANSSTLKKLKTPTKSATVKATRKKPKKKGK